jgi:hypothetical protein
LPLAGRLVLSHPAGESSLIHASMHFPGIFLAGLRSEEFFAP